jgi:glycosyltransferase involved in cell wall biosynthesis
LGCPASPLSQAARPIPEGINGYTLPPEVDAASYAEIIRRAIDSEEHDQRLTMNVYEEFRQRLNWDSFCREFLQLLEERILQQSERRSPVGSSPALS